MGTREAVLLIALVVAACASSSAQEEHRLLWTRHGETQWSLNAAAIMGAGASADQRLSLFYPAADGLFRQGGFLGVFQEPDRTYRFHSVYSYLLDRFELDPGAGLQSVSVGLDAEGRVWWREVFANSCYEEFGQFEKIWGSPTIPDYDKNRQPWGLSVYSRSCPNGAWQPVSQYLGWRARLTFSEAYDESGRPLTGFKGVKTVKFKEEFGLDRRPRWSSLGLYQADREVLVRTGGLIAQVLDGVMKLPNAVAKMIIGAEKPKELPCAGVERYAIFDELSRDQEYVGSCHAFGSVGLLESGIKRQHGKTVRLSELDLLVRGRMGDPEFLKKHGDETGVCRVAVLEGGWPAEDLRLAVRDGVVTARSLPYDLSRDYQNSKPGNNDSCDRDPGSDTCKRPGRIREEVEKLRRTAENKALDAERAVVKNALSGFAVKKEPYPEANAASKPRAMDGQAQLEDMAALLCRGIPVVASMDLVGLQEWGVGPGERDARHAFVVSGFRKEKDGVVFTTRNSWGPSSTSLPSTNPDLPLKHLSRIYGLTFVLTPSDIKAQSPADPVLLKKLDALAEQSR